MAKGYPGKKRARKAFWRGVKSVRWRKAFNPYQHSVLMELFERGRTQAQLTPALLQRLPVSGNNARRAASNGNRAERSTRNPRRAPSRGFGGYGDPRGSGGFGEARGFGGANGPRGFGGFGRTT